MDAINNTRLAALITVILIILSVFFGANRSLSALSAKAEKVFYDGEFGDGLSIQNDLNERINLSYNLVTVAKKYMDSDSSEIQAVLNARNNLFEAETTSQKSWANLSLTEAVTDLYNKMGQLDLSDTDEKYRNSIFESMKSRNDTISHDKYNQFADDFNKQISVYPAKFLAQITGVKELERFN
jgi:hypothetical protein